jgi:hypothetical protein
LGWQNPDVITIPPPFGSSEKDAADEDTIRRAVGEAIRINLQ